MNLISLTHPSADLLAYLTEMALRSLAVGCAAALLLALTRAKAPAVRLYVWSGVLYVALAMPLLGALLPRLRLMIPAANAGPITGRIVKIVTILTRPRPATVPDRLVAAGESSRSSSGIGENMPRTTSTTFSNADCGRVNARCGPLPIGHSGLASANVSSSTTHSSAQWAPGVVSASMPVSIVRRADWKVIAAAIYFAGLLILLGRLLMGIWWTHRLTRSAVEICGRYSNAEDGVENNRSCMAMAWLRSHSILEGLQKPPRLKESEALSVPVTTGVLHPIILLPAGWSRWPSARLEAVLAHEIAHVARRDAFTQFLSLVHRAFFWFSPLGWWLVRQLTELSEQASDEAVLAAGADRTLYAATLLAFFAELEAASRRVGWHAVSVVSGHDSGSAERRVDRILAWKGTSSFRKSFAIALLAFAVPVIYLAASIRPLIAYGQDRSGASAPPASMAAPAVEPVDGAHSSSSANIDLKDGSFAESSLRYVLITGDPKEVAMSGKEEDLQHAQRLHRNINGDFIWFERDDKSYVITDPSFISRVSALFASEGTISKQQDELGRQQNDLGRQQRILGDESTTNAVKVTDITADLELIRGRLKKLEINGATQDELADVQSHMGELQGKIGLLQSEAAMGQSVIGSKQAEMGRRQEDLGRQQAELGRQQSSIAGRVSRELRSMFDNAIATGIAKPE
jgi:bla regulator protein blaR1